MTEETEELVREVFRTDMKTAENMNELAQNHNPNDIAEASVDTVEDLVSKIQDPEREKYVYATLFQVGQAIENEQLSNSARNLLNKWVQQNA